MSDMIAVNLLINGTMSAMAFIGTLIIIPKFQGIFIQANICGIDMSKVSKNKIPEALGVVAGAVFLMVMFLFLPIPFYKHFSNLAPHQPFPHHEYIEYIAALLSICCMIFLGFADDVLDLKWRHKLLLPTMASLPLLMVYFVNYNRTAIMVPLPFRTHLGTYVDLGLLYYVYMGMLAVFCTNAINILSGVNGLESGQSLIIALSLLVFNTIELFGDNPAPHIFSIYFLLPFFAVNAALLYHNWYPSSVFVGDTFCYFSGMTFAVVAILGHFSKTLLLFFIPQVLNFLLSTPQIFRFIPCPRHRLPSFNRTKDVMEPSNVKYKTGSLGTVGTAVVRVLEALHVVRVKPSDDKDWTCCTNLTLPNLALHAFGPMHERSLVKLLLAFQIVCSLFAFFVRYHLAAVFYDRK